MRRKTWVMLAAILFVVAIAGSGWAFTYAPMYLNAGSDYNSDGDSYTGIFNIMEFEDETRTDFAGLIPMTPGQSTTFTDHGHALVTSLMLNNSYVADNEDMRTLQYTPNGSWEITMDWSGLTGTVTKTVVPGVWAVTYDPGTFFNIYFDTSPDYLFGTSTIDPDDSSGYNDGVIKITAQVTGGSGWANLTQGMITRNLAINYKITDLSTDFLYLADGTDLHEFLDAGIIALSTEGTDPQDATLFTDAQGNNYLLAQGDGSFGLNVPEPTTLLLLGCGLLFAGFGLRRRKEDA